MPYKILFVIILFSVCNRVHSNDFKIVCWIPTDPPNHIKSLHLKNTWGKRCDRLLFFSTGYDDILPTTVVKALPTWTHLWGKVRKSLGILYENYLDEGDWFLKADDDTYVIVENLRYMLKDYNSSEPLYFGSRIKHKNNSFMHGGAGYVLSREALKRLVEIAFKDLVNCRSEKNTIFEDLQVAECLATIGVKFGYSRDEFERDRFFPFRIDIHTQPFIIADDLYIWKDMFYISFPGIINCSKKPISFHRVTSGLMYVFEYLVYHVEIMENKK